MEGGHRTRQRIIDVPLGFPLPTYMKEEREEAGPRGARHKGGVLLGLLVLVGFGPPSFPSHRGGKGESRSEIMMEVRKQK